MAEFEQGTDGILTIRVVAEFPDLAAQIANAYVGELEAYQLQTSTGNTERNLLIAEARMNTLERELGVAQRALEAFKTANQNLLKSQNDLVLPGVWTKMDSLQRELDLKKRLYMTVAEQRELLRLQREKDATGIEVINEAESPLGSEDKTLSVMLGTVVGAFLGIILAFSVEYIKSKRESGDLAPLAEAWQQDRARLRRLLRL